MTQSLKILVSDQTTELGTSLSNSFQKNNIQCKLCPKDGQKVYDQIIEYKPDVVVLDCVMSSMDATEVINKAKANLKNVPFFVAVSGYDSPFIEREVMNAGASYYVVKPFDLNVLVKRIISLTGFNKPVANTSQPKLTNLEQYVTNTIHQIGIPAHIKGYHFIRYAIILSIEDFSYLNSVTKKLYPTIAEQFNTTSSRVERAIRHAIEVAWDRGDVDVLNSFFGFTINYTRGKPTNSEFIAMIADRIKLDFHQKLAN